MPIPIEDEDTSRLSEEYAKAQGKTKTCALCDLLELELQRLKEPSAENRYQAALAYVVSTPASGPVTQADIDSLYEYLDSMVS